FIRFLSDLMGGSDIKVDYRSVMTLNEDSIKTKFGQTVRKIILSYYKIIEETCRKQNFYTYEVNQESKAFQIFWCEHFDFLHTKRVKREVLYYLMKNCKELISKEKLDAIDFDPDSMREIVDFLM